MPDPQQTLPTRSELSFIRKSDDTLLIRLGGAWTIYGESPLASEPVREIESDSRIRHIVFDTRDLGEWDSVLLTFLARIIDYCAKQGIVAAKEGLPQGVTKLLELASAVPENKDAHSDVSRAPFFERVGAETIELASAATEMIGFVGEAFVAFARFLCGKARFRRSDLVLLIQDCGAQALPIVSLISVLVGLILAFVGAIQLRLFGAQIYVADLVGLGMAREMGAMMTAIIMAGRTGAAFAAQLGTMQVNEEIDALQTLGVSPMEFLVVPRMLALVLMLPLLCLYANLMGILGGGLVGIGMLDLSPMEYFNETCAAVHIADFLAGLFKSGVFGVLVALSGCLRGMQCGRSSAAVGVATTSAVVTSIVAIVVSDATLTVIYDRLGI